MQDHPGGVVRRLAVRAVGGRFVGEIVPMIVDYPHIVVLICFTLGIGQIIERRPFGLVIVFVAIFAALLLTDPVSWGLDKAHW
jgi:hypothetical protein